MSVKLPLLKMSKMKLTKMTTTGMIQDPQEDPRQEKVLLTNIVLQCPQSKSELNNQNQIRIRNHQPAKVLGKDYAQDKKDVLLISMLRSKRKATR